MSKRLSFWTILEVVILLPLAVYAVVAWYNKKHTPLPFPAPRNHQLADFHLMNQHDHKASLSDWNNKVVVAHVFFTHCPVVCPKMIRNLAKVQAAFPHQKHLLLSSFSIDPERDSVARLQAYAEKLSIGGNWQLLTGDKKTIYQFARKSLLVAANDGDGGPDDFIHSETLVLIDQDKKIRGLYKGTDDRETVRLIEDLKKLLTK